MDRNTVLDLFIKNFIPKEQRERSEVLLKDLKKRARFTDRLNHQWDKVLDMRFISKIPSGTNDFEFTKKELKIKDNELCYVISNYDDIDGRLIEFNEAFEKIYGRGFGSLIINSSADKLYLETELVQGKQHRFIGKR
jgi:PAS domain-containing protein